MTEQLVRTFRGDLFLFPRGTSEQAMAQELAEQLRVPLYMVHLRQMEHNVEQTEYLALLEDQRDSTAYMIFSKEQTTAEDAVYRVCTVDHILPHNFHIACRDNPFDPNNDLFRWFLHGTTNDEEQDYVSTVRECIEHFCETTGHALPPLLFLEQIDARFYHVTRLRDIRDVDDSTYFSKRRRVMAGFHELTQRYPEIPWLQRFRDWRIHGKWNMYDGFLRELIAAGLSQEDASLMICHVPTWIV